MRIAEARPTRPDERAKRLVAIEQAVLERGAAAGNRIAMKPKRAPEASWLPARAEMMQSREAKA